MLDICGFGRQQICLQIWENYPTRRKGEGKGPRDVVARDVVLGGNFPCHCFFFLIIDPTAVRNFDNVFKKRE